MRKAALALPEVTERPSHGAPSFFVKKTKCFANFTDNHHGDGRLALWLAATLDAQHLLVNAEPAHFFVPDYVGHLGWVGVRLDHPPNVVAPRGFDRGLDVARVKALLEQAWRVRAPQALLKTLATR